MCGVCGSLVAAGFFRLGTRLALVLLLMLSRCRLTFAVGVIARFTRVVVVAVDESLVGAHSMTVSLVSAAGAAAAVVVVVVEFVTCCWLIGGGRVARSHRRRIALALFGIALTNGTSRRHCR